MDIKDAEQIQSGRAPKKNKGAYSHTLNYNGVPFECGYDLEGEYFPATETDPAEYPCVSLRSLTVGDTEVTGHDIDEWDERMCLTADIEQELEWEDRRRGR
jgi:hypothetical protein